MNSTDHLDPDDKLDLGRLLHAAARGDRTARATLRDYRRTKAQQPDQGATSQVREGAVQRGRRLHQGEQLKNDRAEYDQ